MLSGFLHFLNSEELISAADIPNDDDAGFENRFRTQKFVYFAKYFGLNLGYGHSMYRYGPYSSSLASDYYGITENLEDVEVNPLPNEFNSEGFLNLVNGRDDGWLEIASTLLDQKPRFTEDRNLVEHVESIKCDYSVDYIQEVLNNLREHNLAL